MGRKSADVDMWTASGVAAGSDAEGGGMLRGLCTMVGSSDILHSQ